MSTAVARVHSRNLGPAVPADDAGYIGADRSGNSAEPTGLDRQCALAGSQQRGAGIAVLLRRGLFPCFFFFLEFRTVT